MQGENLNITNGEYFNKYFVSKFGAAAVPFCESAMDGDFISDIYSDRFVALRAKALGVTEEEYRSKMHVRDALAGGNYQKLCLWFGKDSFCQVNLLMLLAYLEDIKYSGEVKLNYIDDESFELLEADIEVKLGIYKKAYEEILIFKRKVDAVGVLSESAIELYFDYHSDDGKLKGLIRANLHKEKNELITLLLEVSKDYGLSDLQAMRLVNSEFNSAEKI